SLKKKDVGIYGVSQPRMLVRVLLNPNLDMDPVVASATRGYDTSSVDDGNDRDAMNITSLGESTFMSMMNPSRATFDVEEHVWSCHTPKQGLVGNTCPGADVVKVWCGVEDSGCGCGFTESRPEKMAENKERRRKNCYRYSLKKKDVGIYGVSQPRMLVRVLLNPNLDMDPVVASATRGYDTSSVDDGNDRDAMNITSL
nr:hypothetical protein [Tanacetum cinerariifolium]